jgi:hypothetical protein
MHSQQSITLLPPLHCHTLTQRLTHVHQNTRQLRLCLSHKHLNLIDEHIPKFLLVLNQEIRKTLRIRRAYNRNQPTHPRGKTLYLPNIAFVSGHIRSKTCPGHSLNSQ